ncbi:MAG: hypothetical protein U0325_17090 [Polyangiales bacterium]
MICRRSRRATPSDTAVGLDRPDAATVDDVPDRDRASLDAPDVPAPDVARAPDATGCGGPAQRCCEGPTPCAPGAVCNEGFCAPCPGATQACGGVCVDTLTALSHCGRCGNACASGQSCEGGTCTLRCPTGLNACGGRCVDLGRNNLHCGRCDLACEGGRLCEGGACIVSCATGQSVCGAACADTQRSVANCGACNQVCEPPNAEPRCVAGACQVASCAAGFGDCDSNAANGCETALSSVANCGRCNGACVTPNATPVCRAGSCAVGSCAAGFGDCDRDPANGCEAVLGRDVQHCGACGAACPTAPTGFIATCAQGACVNVTANCAPGTAECGGSSASDCETRIDTVQNCGRCGNACTLVHAVSRCASGACAIASCESGFADCDGNAANGCEVDLRTTVTHCGGCGQSCSLVNATARCDGGRCAVAACAQGFADCDGNAANGCEVDLRTSVTSCGACGAACTVRNGTGVCAGGQCGVGACATGFADCDGNLANGCEVRLSDDPSNCGACRNTCVLPNAAARCAAGACQVDRCSDGFRSCDQSDANGCEVDTRTSTQHCGACGVSCFVNNGVGACVAGACRVSSCTPGFADCDGNVGNGCETSTQSSQHCGRCGNACPTGTFCAVDACVSLCGAGFTFCADGCYTLPSDPRHCGACNNNCPSRPNASRTCAAGACGFTCASGFGDCDGDPNNGCETRLDGRDHCGACGRRCASPPNATAFCNSGTCGFTCASGFGDCDGDPSNGCEVDLRSDPGNCGTCLMRCPRRPASSPMCREGNCGYQCLPGRGDCNGLAQDGCETDTFNTNNRCGSCGGFCVAGQCRGGVCTLCDRDVVDFSNCLGLVGGLVCTIDFDSDPGHCGACGFACPNGARPALHATFTGECRSSRCAMTCQMGWANCDDTWQNGCETNITCDSQHCNGCALSSSERGTVCANGAVCCNGTCVPAGAAMCNRSAPGCR